MWPFPVPTCEEILRCTKLRDFANDHDGSRAQGNPMLCMFARAIEDHLLATVPQKGTRQQSIVAYARPSSDPVLTPELEKQIAGGTLKLAGHRSIDERERERNTMLMEWRRDKTVDPDARAVVRSYE